MLIAIHQIKVSIPDGKTPEGNEKIKLIEVAPGEPIPKHVSAEDKKFLLDQGAIGDDDGAGKKAAADKAAAEAEAARIAEEADKAEKARLAALPPA